MDDVCWKCAEAAFQLCAWEPPMADTGQVEKAVAEVVETALKKR